MALQVNALDFRNLLQASKRWHQNLAHCHNSGCYAYLEPYCGTSMMADKRGIGKVRTKYYQIYLDK